MSLRVSRAPALRQFQCAFTQAHASFSSTSRAASLKNATSDLLSLNRNTDSTSSSYSPTASGPYAARTSRQPPGRESSFSASNAMQFWKQYTETQETTRQNRESRAVETMRQSSDNKTTDMYARHLTRRWAAGEVYAPHDLSPGEMRKWRKGSATRKDVVDMLGINPVDMYKNFSMISEFVTSFGRIKGHKDTGLRTVNQRKMAKAIRRAIGLGLHPSVHGHPELLRKKNPNWFGEQRVATKKIE